MKRILLIFTLFLFVFISNAQIPWFSLEFKAGIGMNNVKYGNNLDIKLAPGIIGGVNAKFGKKLFIEPGIYFSQNRSSYEGMLAGVAVNDVLSYSSTKLSAHLGYNLIDRDLFKISIHAGATIDVFGSVKKNNLNIIDSDFNKANSGLAFGASAQVLIFTIGAEYQKGMSDIIVNQKSGNMFSVFLGISIL